MTSELLKTVRIKCKMATPEAASNYALAKYVNYRDKLKVKTKVEINYKDNANEYGLHCLKVKQSYFLPEVGEPELLALKQALTWFNYHNKTKFIAIRVKDSKTVELCRLH